jgi:hypothetical protein
VRSIASGRSGTRVSGWLRGGPWPESIIWRLTAHPTASSAPKGRLPSFWRDAVCGLFFAGESSSRLAVVEAVLVTDRRPSDREAGAVVPIASGRSSLLGYHWRRGASSRRSWRETTPIGDLHSTRRSLLRIRRGRQTLCRTRPMSLLTQSRDGVPSQLGMCSLGLSCEPGSAGGMNMAIATVESEEERPAINNPSDAPAPEVWSLGVQLLHDLLQQGGGIVSSRALRQALEQKHVPDARRLVLSLKYFDFDAPLDEGHPRPPFRWFSHAKSLYSEERYAKLRSAQEQQAAKAEQVIRLTGQDIATRQRMQALHERFASDSSARVQRQRAIGAAEAERQLRGLDLTKVRQLPTEVSTSGCPSSLRRRVGWVAESFRKTTSSGSFCRRRQKARG